MKYEVTPDSGVSLHENTPDHDMIGITKATVERIIQNKQRVSECLALYSFYAFTCKWQKNTSAHANRSYCMKVMGWGKDKYHEVKKILEGLGLIEDECRKGENGKIEGWYVKVRYLLKNQCPYKPDSGFHHPVDSSPQIPCINNKIPSTVKKDTKYQNKDSFFLNQFLETLKTEPAEPAKLATTRYAKNNRKL